jgi:steroid delta-isomerase-like uncharacterized protein
MLLRLVILAALVPACAARTATPPRAAEGPDLAARNADAARTAFAVLEQRDFDRFEALHTKDFVKHYNNRPTESLAEEMRDARGQAVASSDLGIKVNWVVAEKDRVAVHFTSWGTNDGPIGSMPPTGKRFNLTAMTVWRFVDGLIAEEWVFLNDLDLYQALGLAGGPAPRGAGGATSSP